MTTPDEVQTRGPFVTAYSGVGRLTFADGHSSEDGVFWTGQAHNGDVLICLDEDMHTLVDLDSHLASFSGQTESGLHLETHGPLHPIQQSMQFMEQTFRLVILASEVSLIAPEAQDITKTCYGLTNFLFCGTEPHEAGPGHWQLVLPLIISCRDRTIVGRIHMVPDYDSLSHILTATRAIKVTAELEINVAASEISMGDLDTAVDSLCRVLSLARGTHVMWICRTSVDAEGHLVDAVYSNRPTFGYHNAPILDDGPGDAANTRQFVETTYSEYIAKSAPYMLDKGSLDTYLEGKAEGQFLETRALKLVVAMEMLVAGHFHDPAVKRSDRMIDPSVFDAMVPELASCIFKTVLSHTAKQASDRKHAKRISAPTRVSQLNERPFEDLVYVMWQDIGLQASPVDAHSIQLTRNSLVHTGQFACARIQERFDRVETHPWSTPVEEYFSLVSLLDRTFLRILNYDGPYIDWCVPSHPQRRLHVNE